jgi:hypothetical protein
MYVFIYINLIALKAKKRPADNEKTKLISKM